MTLYDHIGVGYDSTRQPDPYLFSRIIDLLEPQPGRPYVDVACGTGNYTLKLASAGILMTGFDASREMIKTAKAKPKPAALQAWLVADAARTPFESGIFAGGICTLASHHFSDLSSVFAEISRILDPETGRFLIFTSSPEQMSHYWLNRYFPEMMKRSGNQMQGIEIIEDSLVAAGFQKITVEPYSVSPTLEDMFLYSGKHRPHFYLDPCFRAGISSFANLGDASEIEQGILRLSHDIASGEIARVIGAAEGEGGDYSFVLARR